MLSKTSKVTKTEKQNHDYKAMGSVSESLSLLSFIHALSVVLKQSLETTGKLSTMLQGHPTAIFGKISVRKTI